MAGILLPAGCCCAVPCGSCPAGKTPKSLRVTFSLLAACGCNDSFSAPFWYSHQYTVAPSIPAGPYILAQDRDNPCRYQYDEAATGTLAEYSGIGCGGAPANTWSIDRLFVKAVIGADGAGSVRLWAWWRVVDFYPGGDENGLVFQGGDASQVDCLTFGAIANERVDCAVIPGDLSRPVSVDNRCLGCEDGSATVVVP